MLGVSYYMTQQMRIYMIRQVDSQINSELNEFVSKLEKIIIEYNDKSIMLANNDALSKKKMLAHKSGTMEGLHFISNVKEMDDKLYDLAVIYGQKTYIPNGYCSLNTYMKEYLQLKSDHEELYKELLLLNKNEVIYVEGKNGDYLIVICPIRSRNSLDEDFDSINFVIQMDQIYGMLLDSKENEKMMYKITFDFQKESICLRGNREGELYRASETEFYNYMNNNSYNLISVKSQYLGLTVDVWYDINEQYQTIFFWKRVNECSMFVLLFISLFISYAISRRYFKKVYNIKQNVSLLLGSGQVKENKNGRNEFDNINNMLRSVGLNLEYTNKAFISARSNLRDQLAYLVFNGYVSDEENIKKQMKALGLEITEPFFLVAAIGCQHKEVINKLAESMSQSGRMNQKVQIDGVLFLFVLFEIQQEDYMYKLRNGIVQRIKGEIGQEYSLQIGFSRIYGELTNIQHAYAEVSKVAYKFFNTELQGVIYCEKFEIDKSKEICFPAGSLERFEDAVIKENEYFIQISLEYLLNYIFNSDLEEEDKQYLKCSLIQSVIDCGNVQLPIFNEVNMNDDVIFEKEIRNCLEQITRKQDFEKRMVFSKVLEYINCNYHRYDLSLEEVAEYSGCSKSYLSRIFKQKIGIKYMDYLTQCRMEQAKKLLDETDYSIKQICEMVGYMNVPGFRSKFKEYYGVNASEYRKNRNA